MNLQNIQFLSILLFIFLGCNTKEDKRIETIEMLSNNDYIIFDTQINDKQGYFLFDTHSSVNVIYKKSWDTLEYKITGITKVNNVDVETDRKSTRLNSSHVRISYAVFCLKKKKKKKNKIIKIKKKKTTQKQSGQQKKRIKDHTTLHSVAKRPKHI